jgi:hypothetical protein
MAEGLTLDSGALIAAEKQDRHFWTMWEEALERGALVTVPAPVVAQVWRGNRPLIARLLQACQVEALDEAGAKRVGELLAKSRTPVIVEAVVVLGAAARRDAVLTSDPDDIRRLADALRRKLRVIEI